VQHVLLLSSSKALAAASRDHAIDRMRATTSLKQRYAFQAWLATMSITGKVAEMR
jgi:hypothetical protein